MQTFTNVISYTAAAVKLVNYLNEAFKPELLDALLFITTSHNRFANDVAKIQKLMKEFTAHEREKNANALRVTSSAIWDILNQYTSAATKQSSTFHRDLVRARI